MRGGWCTALNRTSASLRGGGQAASQTGTVRLVPDRHCEEHSAEQNNPANCFARGGDEAIQRTVGSSGTFRSVTLVDAHTRAGSPRRLKGLLVMTCAFTMAEILLSLTIIGVVAAITLPSLTGNINERTWNTQRKALYARMSQAISLMPALNGYGTLNSTTDNAAETFITAGLSKVLKINNVCDSEHLVDCGIPNKIITLNASVVNPIPKTLLEWNDRFDYEEEFTGVNGNSFTLSVHISDTKAAAFETANGESLLVYYAPSCSAEKFRKSQSSQNRMCANFIYDLNGTKGPNTVGKDIGVMTVLYATDSVVVAPMPRNKRLDGTYSLSPGDGAVAANTACTNFDSGYRLPNIEELMSISYNKLFMDVELRQFWSSSRDVSDFSRAMNIDIRSGYVYLDPKTHSFSVLCVKR